MNKKTETKNKTIRFLSRLLLATLLIFAIVASAETQEPITDDTTATEVASAGAFALAAGDETSASTSASASNNGAAAYATAKAIASDGETAVAMTEAWANIADVAYAYARALATAVSGVGETVYAYAYVGVSVSQDGTANAIAVTSAGPGRGDNIGSDGSNGESGEEGSDSNGENGEEGSDSNQGGSSVAGNNRVMRPAIKQTSLSGFIFGKDDVARYCTFKLQLDDDDLSNDARAKYYMRDVIAWGEYGLTEQEFEEKYDTTVESCTQIVGDEPEDV